MRVVNMFFNRKSIARVSFLFVLIASIAICSCRRNTEVSNLSSNIVFPNSLQLLSYGYSNYKGIDDEYKILIVFDSLVCSDCVINRLVIWKDVLEYADSTDILSVVMIFSPPQKDRTRIENELQDNPVGYPIYIDNNNEFIKENNTGRGIHVSLLDKTNNIILRGNPINNDELWSKYKSLINE